ncbi:M-factor transporter Mam1 [Schizosaccharomyces japonicus yFS275]|uniref:M-factor transporter Mam1 n=1 Tax=Schizosaccharomyces japonicus (strain yFS275 / FY16936) TaxID=402676 RepID=B6K0P4_SCHJY|nr:M-factor transporter Mam1 [Schizosaccharomyces japonicus yFS275]EEB07515.1 M-factor transporter Mam1 [Schizosaccharomyces japonicus yFS275]
MSSDNGEGSLSSLEKRSTTLSSISVLNKNRDESKKSKHGDSKAGNHDDSTETSDGSRWQHMLLGFTRRDIPVLIFVVLLTLSTGVLEPLMTWASGRLFDGFSKYARGDYSTRDLNKNVNTNVGLVAIFGLISLFLDMIVRFCWRIVGDMVARRTRLLIFGKLAEKRASFYLLNDNTIGLINSMDRNVLAYQRSVSLSMNALLENLAIVVASLVIAFHYSWSLTLVVIAIFPVLAIFVGIINSLLFSSMEKERVTSENCASLLERAVAAIRTVRFHSMKTFEHNEFIHVMHACSKAFLRFSFFTSIQAGVTAFLLMAVFFQGLWYGNHLVVVGKLTPGKVVTVFWTCVSAMASLNQIVPIVPDFVRGKYSAFTIIESYSKPAKGEYVQQISGDYAPVYCDGSIQFQNVSFRYPTSETAENRYVLVNVSMEVYPGGLTFIVGSSGSGKSTIATLLMGFFPPTCGDIFIDNHSLKTLEEDWLSENVTFVQQSPVVFSMSIRENILLGIQDAPVDAFEKACRLALVDEFVNNLPNGYDTLCTSDTLSGGQRQRISLARALLRDTPILVLDEATSALDPISKSLINAAIRENRQGKTTLIITHDFEEISAEDYVYVMNEGHVIHRGLKSELSILDDFGNPLAMTECYNQPSTSEELSYYDTNEFQRSESEFETCYVGSSFASFFTALNNEEVREFIESNLSLASIRRIDSSVHKRRASSKHRRTISIPPLLTENVMDENVDTTMGMEKTHTFMQIFKSVYEVKTARIFVGLGLILALIEGATTPVFSFIISKVLNTFMQTDMGKHAAFWSSMVLVVAFVCGIAKGFCEYVLCFASQQWTDFHRSRAVRCILAQDQTWFDNPRNTPLLCSKTVVNYVTNMRLILTSLLSQLAVAFCMTFIGLLWAFIIGWRLSIVVLALVPVMLISSNVFSIVYVKLEQKCQTATIAATEALHETIVNLNAIKGLGVLPYFRDKHLAAVLTNWKAGVKRSIFTSIGFAFVQSLSYFMRALLFWYSAKLIMKNEYTVQQMVTVLALAVFSLCSASMCISSLPNISESRICTSRILRLAELKPGQQELSGKLTFPFCGKVEFKNVTFSYTKSSPEGPALKNVSFSIKPNEKLVIAGVSGSGKSTIAAILMKLYACSGVYIDDHPLSEISTEWLRKKIAIVEQKPFLMGKTILESLSYGSAPSLDEVKEAVRNAHVEDLIESLPDGFNSSLKENSGNLSGGQLQRLAIARALLRKPRLLILDECTSALDPHSAMLIEKTISELSDCTVLIITHHPSMMRIGDRIIVMERGCCVETGTFEELMIPNTVFWSLVHRGIWSD